MHASRRAGLATGLLVGLLLLATSLGAVTAYASARARTAPPPSAAGNYCREYIQTLTSSLHVTVAQFQAAHEHALQQTIQRAYADGKITKQQETNLLNKAAQAKDPCVAIDQAAAAHAQLQASRTAVVSAVAAKLQMQPSALQSALASGQTVPQLAAAKGVSLKDVNTAYLDAAKNQLNMAVQRGDLTSSQADQAYTRIQKAVANGYYPLLEPGHEPGSMHW